jgi:methyl-accepting chemotaxis protein
MPLREITPMPNIDSQTIQLAIVAVVALAVLLQAFVLLAIYFAIRKAARSLREDVDNLRSSVMPIVDRTRDLVNHVAPRFEAAADDLADMTRGLRVQTADVQAAAGEVVERMRRQASRVDAMMSGVLDTIDRVAGFMTDAVSKPIRQISGLLASAKAIIESLRESVATIHPPHASSDKPPADEKDMFV